MQKFNKLSIGLAVLSLGWGLVMSHAQASQATNHGWNYSTHKIAMSSPQIPTSQSSPEPPASLLQILDTIRLPVGYQSGLTTTDAGNWALLVRVPRGTVTPIAEVEAIVAEYPIVYQILADSLPVARPAYPHLGE